MPLTLMASLCQTQFKTRTQNKKPENQTETSSLPSNLQVYNQKLLSVIGFTV